MRADIDKNAVGKHLRSGADHYRAYIGSPEIYDLLVSSHFNLLTYFGLREHHTVLDIGCGSLRVGKLLIVFLLPGRYYGIEPNEWLVKEVIEKECGHDMISLKRPTFAYVSDFSLSRFGRSFDFVFAHSIFSHASQLQIETCLKEASKCMKLETVFLATYKKGEKDYVGQDWVYPELAHYRPETMFNMAQKYGLCCHEVPFDTLIGQTWLVFTRPDHSNEVARLISNINNSNYMTMHYMWKEKYEQLLSHPWVKIGRYLRRLLLLRK